MSPPTATLPLETCLDAEAMRPRLQQILAVAQASVRGDGSVPPASA